MAFPLLSSRHSYHPSLPHAFTQGLKPSFSTNLSHRTLLFILQDWLHGGTDSSDCYRYFWAYPFFFFFFSTFVVFPCGRLSWLTSVSFWAQVKKAYRIASSFGVMWMTIQQSWHKFSILVLVVRTLSNSILSDIITDCFRTILWQKTSYSVFYKIVHAVIF